MKLLHLIKKCLLFSLISLLVVSSSAFAAPLPTDEVESKLLDKLSVENTNKFIGKLNQELKVDIPSLNHKTIADICTNGLQLNWQNIFRNLGTELCKELISNIHLLSKLLFLAVLCALLQNLQSSFEKFGVALLAYTVCYIFMMTITLTIFYNMMVMARDTVGNMVGFMEALLPLLLSLIAAVGAISTAALFTPLMVFVLNSVSVVIRDIVLPFLLLAVFLDCINYLSDKYRLTNLCSLFKQCGMMTLSFTLVLFIGVITIYGITGSAMDGLALRTAKFATSTFVPVVGGMFADAVSVVMSASLLLKNAVGIFGILVIAMVCVFPLIKLLALTIILKAAGALIQPVGDEKMASCLNSIGNQMLLVFGAVATVTLMFFLVITIIIGIGNITTLIK
ncbi:MAG: stage III sporulation protein AE [Pelosinus sp.]|nr:stage III sporulation protein AE [Pelosinus sp.]